MLLFDRKCELNVWLHAARLAEDFVANFGSSTDVYGEDTNEDAEEVTAPWQALLETS